MIQTVLVGQPCRVPSCRIACDQWVDSSVQVFLRRGLPWVIGRGKNLTCERTWKNSGIPVLLDLDLQFKVSRLLAFLFFAECLNSSFKGKMCLLLSFEDTDIRKNLAQKD